MADNFENDIKEIARSVGKGEGLPAGASLPDDNDKIFLAAIDEFYVLTRRAVTIFNAESADVRLSLQRLTPDFLDLFLSITGRRGGFSVSSPSRIAILFDEDPNGLTVIGKKRKTEKNGEGKLSAAIQLIKISFEKSGDSIVYEDNSGGALDPHGLVTLFIRWVSAA
jgi:hypothetical protein